VLGHAIGGVAGVYDRHRYDAEKADALNKLAHLIGTIIKPEESARVETSRIASAIVLGIQVLDLDRAPALPQIRPCRQQTLVSKVRHQNASDCFWPGRLRIRVTGYPNIKRGDLIAVYAKGDR
jgi:hypothetical protein